jgi:serine/threonine protein phosphatase 1
MLFPFFRHGRETEPPALTAAPPGIRIYAVGDIHGCAGLLRQLQRMIEEDAAAHDAERKLIIYLGDYVDRGPDSRAVLDLLIDAPLEGFERVFLKGNHEASLLQFLCDDRAAPAWMAYGGDATLFSYGVRPPDPAKPDDWAQARHAFAEKLPPEHLVFLRETKLLHSEGDYVFVHAGLRWNVALREQSARDMLWIRDEFLNSSADFGKLVVHGHTITDAPEIRRNRIGIDTGAFATGCLTCLVLQGTSRSFLAT